MTGPVPVTDLLMQVVARLANDVPFARQFAGDPEGTLAEQGITEHDLSGIDMRQVVSDACNTYPMPAEARESLQSYTQGGGNSSGYTAPPPGPTHGMGDVVQHMTYVTYETHQGDTEITQTILDQSTDIEIHGDSNAPIDVSPAAAVGEGAAAQSGDGTLNQASGDGSQILNNSTVGQNMNNSDGAVQVEGGSSAPIITGGVGAGAIVNDDGTLTGVNTGTFQGNLNTGTQDDVAFGNSGPVLQNDGAINAPIGFGGNINNVQNSTLDQSAVGGNNAVTNLENVDNSQGGAIGGTGGSATGGYSDDDTTTTTTEATTVTNSEDVNVEHGPGNQDFQELTHEEAPEEPKTLEEMGS